MRSATAAGIFSGRECRSAVIACKSICCHWPSFLISLTSRAIAAQVITSIGAESGMSLRHSTALATLRSARSPFSDQFLGSVRGDRGIATIGVRADSLAELLVQRRATDENDVIVTNTLLLHGVDDDLHVGHGRGQQRRHAEDFRFVLFERSQVVLDRRVDA